MQSSFKKRLKRANIVEEVPVAKQTGRRCGVKGSERPCLMQFAVAGALLALISGCASTWHNPGKSSQEASADEKLCAVEAEDTALTRAARQKVDYNQNRQGNLNAGLNRGETPMQLAERSRTVDVYSREFESCMRTKGYTQGGSENP